MQPVDQMFSGECCDHVACPSCIDHTAGRFVKIVATAAVFLPVPVGAMRSKRNQHYLEFIMLTDWNFDHNI